MSAVAHRPLVETGPNGRQVTPPRAGGLSGMVWLTWRQHRSALLSAFILTVVLVGWMTYLSVAMTSLYHQCHSTQCPSFSPQYAKLHGDFGLLHQAEQLGLVVLVVPLLIGVFLGVPVLAREHEQRTLLLAWSQDISPVRWLWTKLALLGAFVAALTGALAAASDHLAHVYAAHMGGGLFTDKVFPITGVLPLASGVCWFALGVALGAVVRRTLPAIFAVVAGYAGVTALVQWRYPTLMRPRSTYVGFGQPGPGAADPNALIVNPGHIFLGRDQVTNLYDAPGHQITSADLQSMCPAIGLDPTDCLQSNHLLTHLTYQPSSRIPAFHLLVSSGYLGLTAIALAAVWLIVRRTHLSAG
jgi:hypothetical protein